MKAEPQPQEEAAKVAECLKRMQKAIGTESPVVVAKACLILIELSCMVAESGKKPK